jgi:uncharacterized protein YlxP (DUF503 family)
VAIAGHIMHVLVAAVEIHIPAARSLKAKRSTVTSIVRHLDRLHGVAASEVAHLDVWQRARIGVAVVADTVSRTSRVMDGVERYIWSRPDIEVLDVDRSWWDDE